MSHGHLVCCHLLVFWKWTWTLHRISELLYPIILSDLDYTVPSCSIQIWNLLHLYGLPVFLCICVTFVLPPFKWQFLIISCFYLPVIWVCYIVITSINSNFTVQIWVLFCKCMPFSYLDNQYRLPYSYKISRNPHFTQWLACGQSWIFLVQNCSRVDMGSKTQSGKPFRILDLIICLWLHQPNWPRGFGYRRYSRGAQGWRGYCRGSREPIGSSCHRKVAASIPVVLDRELWKVFGLGLTGSGVVTKSGDQF